MLGQKTSDSGAVFCTAEAPLVTVAIPLYNHARFIVDGLNSVLAQLPVKIELVLIDDGSTDNGFELASEWASQHGANFVSIDFSQQANAGITATMDKLIRKSTGQYILLLASDDLLIPHSIARRLVEFQDPKILAVFGDAVPMLEDGTVSGRSAIQELGQKASRAALSDPRTLAWELIYRWNIYGSVLICRREALIDEDGKSVLDVRVFCEDMQLYYKFATANALKYIDEPVAYYRLHATNTSKSPALVQKFRQSEQRTKASAMKDMPFLKKAVVAAQYYSYYRWAGTGCNPLKKAGALGCAIAVRITRNFYDAHRRLLYGQPVDY